MSRILISACLLGAPVRYDGRGRALTHDLLTLWQAQGRLVPLCPEVAGGLPTPRPATEIEPGARAEDVLDGTARILTAGGEDVTAPFLQGARLALAAAQAQGCTAALLMEGSPSCGSLIVHSGHHDGRRQPGQGVTAALLRRHGIAVFPPDRIEDLARHLAQAPAGAQI